MKFNEGLSNIPNIKTTQPLEGSNTSRKKLWEPPENDHIDTKHLGDAEKDQFILAYTGLVEMIAFGIWNKNRKKINFQDLVQDGMVGLITAMSKYDPKNPLNASFSTFAERPISGAMIDGLRRQDTLTRTMRTALKRISEMSRKNEDRQRCGLEPLTDEEIAKELNMDVGRYREYLILAAGDAVNARELNLSSKYMEVIPDENAVSVETALHEKKIKEKVKIAAEQFFSSIESDERRAKFRRMYEEYYLKGRTTSDIGNDHHLSPSRIYQVLMQIKKGIGGILKKQGVTKEDIN